MLLVILIMKKIGSAWYKDESVFPEPYKRSRELQKINWIYLTIQRRAIWKEQQAVIYLHWHQKQIFSKT